MAYVAKVPQYDDSEFSASNLVIDLIEASYGIPFDEIEKVDLTSANPGYSQNLEQDLSMLQQRDGEIVLPRPVMVKIPLEDLGESVWVRADKIYGDHGDAGFIILGNNSYNIVLDENLGFQELSGVPMEIQEILARNYVGGSGNIPYVPALYTHVEADSPVFSSEDFKAILYVNQIDRFFPVASVGLTGTYISFYNGDDTGEASYDDFLDGVYLDITPPPGA